MRFLIDHAGSPYGLTDILRRATTSRSRDDRRSSGTIQTRAGRSYVKSQGVTGRCYGSLEGWRLAIALDRPVRERPTTVTGADPNRDPAYAASLFRRAEG